MNPLPVLSSGSSASSTGSASASQSARNEPRSQTDQCRSSSDGEAVGVAREQLGHGCQRAVAVERPVAVRDDEHDHPARDPAPLLERADRVGEVLDHVRREHEVERVVRERQPVARRDDVDGPGAPALVPLVALVDVSSEPSTSTLSASTWKSLCAAPPISIPLAPSSQRCTNAESRTVRRLLRTRRGWRSAKPAGWPSSLTRSRRAAPRGRMPCPSPSPPGPARRAATPRTAGPRRARGRCRRGPRGRSPGACRGR